MIVRTLLLSCALTLGLLTGCHPVDEAIAVRCTWEPCECNEDASDCCIAERGHCYEGQCCDGLVCGAEGRCVPGS